MGFTPFPWDTTEEALFATQQVLFGLGDLVAHKLDGGVPWPEAAEGDPFPLNLQIDWEVRRAQSRGRRVCLSLSPLDPERRGLALYRGEAENLPLPGGISQGLPLNDPGVKQAYRQYVLRAVRFFDPTYLAIAVDVNELILKAPEKWPQLVELCLDTRDAVKAAFPDLPVTASISLHALAHPELREVNQQAALTLDFLARLDYVGVNYHPVLLGSLASALSPLETLRQQVARPLAILETSFPGETLRLPSAGVTLISTPAMQAAYLDALLASAGEHDDLFVVYLLARDFDALWNRLQDEAPEFLLLWRDCGLLEGDGDARPSLAVWGSHFLRSLQVPGDCNQDGSLDVSDAICLLGHLFLGSPEELPCGDAASAGAAHRSLLDHDDDGSLDISDAVSVLKYLFAAGGPPAAGEHCQPIPRCRSVCAASH